MSVETAVIVTESGTFPPEEIRNHVRGDAARHCTDQDDAGRQLALKPEQLRQEKARGRHDPEVQDDANDHRARDEQHPGEVRHAERGAHPEHDDLNQREG